MLLCALVMAWVYGSRPASAQHVRVNGVSTGTTTTTTGTELPTTIRLAADQTFTTTTAFTTVPGFSFNVTASQSYRVESMLFLNAVDVGGGWKATFAGGATMTNFIGRANIETQTTNAVLTVRTTYGASALPSTAGNPTYSVHFLATFTVNAGGTFVLQWAQQTATGSTTLARGSYITLTPIS
jgi:hypothetical protein